MSPCARAVPSFSGRWGAEPDAEREIFLILSILPIPLAVAVPVVPQFPAIHDYVE
jgi:hypothetical protein